MDYVDNTYIDQPRSFADGVTIKAFSQQKKWRFRNNVYEMQVFRML